MDSNRSRRRPCFIEEDDGLASLAETETGFSGNHDHNHYQHPFLSRSMVHYSASNRTSFRNLSTVSSPRSGRFYDARFEDHQPHFLDSCFLCKKPLGDKDIFMYRGDTPFCSEECRMEQIEKDEANEKNWNLSSMKALRTKEQKGSTSPNKTQDYPYHKSTVAAA